MEECDAGRFRCRRGPPGAGARVARFRFLPARAVGHGQQGGNRQHQPVPAHARGVQAARLVPLPAYGFQAPEPLFNPMVDALDVRAPGLHRCVQCVGGPLFSISMDNGIFEPQAHHKFAPRMSVLFRQDSYSLDEAREKTQP